MKFIICGKNPLLVTRTQVSYPGPMCRKFSELDKLLIYLHVSVRIACISRAFMSSANGFRRSFCVHNKHVFHVKFMLSTEACAAI